MARLNIDYDLLTWEGDILRLQFWAHAFEHPEGARRGVPADRGPAGRLLGDADRGRPAATARRRPSRHRRRRAGRRRRASARRSSSARTAWSPTSARTSPTSSGSSACSAATSTTARSRRSRDGGRCGRRPAIRRWRAGASAVRRAPTRSTTSSTSRQSYLQKLLKQALRRRRPSRARPSGSTHFSYEMVALSHATARELGYAPPPDSDDAKKPFVEVSGRKGLGVKADDLLDRLIDKAAGEVDARNPGAAAADERARTAAQIARRRRPLLHAEVLARQGDRLRHRRGAELRGRERAVPAVRRRPRQQHLRRSCRSATGVDEAALLARRWRRTRRRRAGRRRAADTSCGRSCSRRRGSTRSSSRSVRIARVLGAGEVRVRPGAERSTRFYHTAPILNEERAGRAPLARGRRRLLPPAARRARSI